jgi:hypothetical protein
MSANNIQAPLPQLNVYLNSTGQWTFACFVILLLAYAYYRWRIGEKTKNESYSVADETKRFTWFVAGGAIIATMFASDTPFVVGNFIRSRGGVGWNWFWQSGLIAFSLGTFLYAEIWVRLRLYADAALPLLRFGGKRAKILMVTQSLVELLARNNAVMGTVCKAMVMVVLLGFNVSGVYFTFEGIDLFPHFLPHGESYPASASLTFAPEPFIFFVMLAPVVVFSLFSGFRGMILADNAQIILAALMFFGAMINIWSDYGISGTVDKGQEVLASGETRNSLVKVNRSLFAGSVAKPEQLLREGILVETSHLKDEYVFSPNITGLNRKIILVSVNNEKEDPFYRIWELNFVPKLWRFKNKETIDRLKTVGLLDEQLFPPKHITDIDAYILELDKHNIEKTEICAFLTGQRVTHPDTMGSLMLHYPFSSDLIYTLVGLFALLGLQPILGSFIGGYAVQRLKDCKNEFHAVGAGLFHSTFSFALRYHPWTVLGIASLFLVPSIHAYGVHLNGEAGVAIAGFVIFGAGFFGGAFISVAYGAYMSTMTSQLFHGGSYILELWTAARKKKASPFEEFVVGKVAIVLLISLLLYYVLHVDNLLAGWELAIELMAGAGLPTVFMFWYWRINCYSIIAGVVGSLVAYVLLHGFGPIDALVAWLWSLQSIWDFELTYGIKVFHYISAYLFGDTWYLEEESFRLIVSVLTVAPIWITVTLLTDPEPPEVRRRFFARALPFGWWPEEVKYFNYQEHHILFPWSRLACAVTTSLAGIFLIIGFTKLVFGEMIGWIYIPPAVLLGFLIFKIMKKINFTRPPVPKELYDEVFKDYEYIEIFAETARGKTKAG